MRLARVQAGAVIGPAQPAAQLPIPQRALTRREAFSTFAPA